MKTAEHIIETVDKLVRKYHTRDPYELCQLLGIKIHYYDLQKKLKGFFYYQSRQKNIVIDHNVNGILERILVAHELGHAVLHTKIAMMHGFQEMEVFDDRSIFTFSRCCKYLRIPAMIVRPVSLVVLIARFTVLFSTSSCMIHHLLQAVE